MGQKSKPKLSVRKTISGKKKKALKNLWEGGTSTDEVNEQVSRLQQELCVAKNRKKETECALAAAIADVNKKNPVDTV